MGRVLSTGRAVPDASQARSRLIPLPASRVGAVRITVAQRRELRLRKYLAQGPTALERQSCKSNPGLSASKPFAWKARDVPSLRRFPSAGSRAGAASAPFSLSGSLGAGPRKGDGR